jgi:hypothetical protein
VEEEATRYSSNSWEVVARITMGNTQ